LQAIFPNPPDDFYREVDIGEAEDAPTGESSLVVFFHVGNEADARLLPPLLTRATIRMTFWRLLDERGSDGFAAADLRLHLGEDWKTAPVQKARRMAEFIDDPLNPASALTVLE